jgi:polyhydroxyalkanoate synthesis regulator phasin
MDDGTMRDYIEDMLQERKTMYERIFRLEAEVTQLETEVRRLENELSRHA